jgi:hypothetical protein
MAENGGVEGLISEEAEGQDAAAGVVNADSVAAAIAMDVAAVHPAVAEDASEFLKVQRQLVSLQIKHFDEERELGIAAAKRKRYSDRIRNSLATLVLVIVGGIALTLGVAAWHAVHDHDLVVDRFSVPPDLAAKGLTGEVVAAQIIDRLNELQKSTETVRPETTYRNQWGKELKLEIPETGISLDELRRYLAESFGHQTRITGEIYRVPTGVAIVARTDEIAGSSFSGTEDDMASLIRQAAESIYRETQPYRYAAYQVTHGRHDEAVQEVERLTHSDDASERAWAHNGLAAIYRFCDDQYLASATEARHGLAENPNHGALMYNLVWSEQALGHDAEALRLQKQFQASESKLGATITDARLPGFVAANAWLGFVLRGDYPAAIKVAESMIAAPRISDQLEGRELFADALTLSHDLHGASEAATTLAPSNRARLLVAGIVALERNDQQAVSMLTNGVSGPDEYFVSTGIQISWLSTVRDRAWIALAKAQFGDLSGAQALIETTPEDCYLCARMRGQISWLAGHRQDAEHWFDAAIHQATELPQAYIDRGGARLAWGDLPGALADATRATEVSEHNADAWKLWGDAMAKQGKTADAIAKYDEAIKYAPSWKELKDAREGVAKRNI